MKAMRRFIPAALLLAFSLAAWAGLIQWRETTKTNADTGVPARVAPNRGANFQRATFYGRKAARTDNTGTVYIGTNSTNDTQTVAITAGSSVVVEAPVGSFYDLYDIYVDVATADDGVVVIYSYP